MRKSLVILSVPVDNISMQEALERLEEFVMIGRATGKTHQIATINADFVVNALHDPELRRILQAADMATADGMPLVLGARLLGVHLEGRVTGADMVPALAERAAHKGFSIYLLGAMPGVADRAAQVLRQRYPGLHIAGIASPPLSSIFEMDPSIVEELNAVKPDILLVAFGNPKQEKWINMHAHELSVPVCIGVGGTFDLIAGVTKRAPQWMQRLGLEWLFRLLQEPRRLWKRYVLDIGYFGFFFVRQWWKMQIMQPRSALQDEPNVIVNDSAALFQVRGRLDTSNLADFTAQAEKALETSAFLVVDLSEATFLDSSALGALVTLTNRARAMGGTLTLAAVPPRIMQTLSLVRLDKFFEVHDDAEYALTTPQKPQHIFDQSVEDDTGWRVIKMPRSLEASTVPLMLETCTSHLSHGTQLVLDFSETQFLSSAGLMAMTKLDRQLKDLGGALRIAGCSKELMYSIQLANLDKIVSIYHDVQAAIYEDVETIEMHRVLS